MRRKIETGIGIVCILIIVVAIIAYCVSLHEDTHYVYEKIETTTVAVEESSTVTEKETSTTETTTQEVTSEKETEQNNSIYTGIQYKSTTAKPTDFSKLGRNLILVNNDFMLPGNFEWNLVYWYNGSKTSVETLALPKNKDVIAVDAEAYQPLKDMFQAAQDAGVPLQLVSAYRSIQRQDVLFGNSVSTGISSGLSEEDAIKKANLSRMRPGSSEHNIGLGFDILAKGNFYLKEDFKNTPEYAWLIENAENYGFILRYPEDKIDITKITYEPWHFRYVGIEHAKKINELGYCLEEYVNYLNSSTQ